MLEINQLKFLNLVSSSVMFAVIFLVQFVIYPSFKNIKQSDFLNFHRSYCNLISWLVIPAMFTELISTGLLSYFYTSVPVIVALILTIIAWLSTFILQVPIHQSLNLKHDLELIDRLVKTNWIRSIAWCLNFILAIFFI